MRYVVDVEVTRVGVERPWSRRPRLLVDGEELASDRWDRRLLDMPDGSQKEVRLGYDAFVLGPRLEVAGKHHPVGRRRGGTRGRSGGVLAYFLVVQLIAFAS